MSVTTMVVLLGCSVGCVSFEHHLRRHSVVTHVAEKQAGRYYHCPHCGQIVPREGFSKCPRCFQVPAYHGYEPTCWRQWPEGWGCPPESVVNNPDFWAHGMVESDAAAEQVPPQDDRPRPNRSQPPAEELDKPLPDAEPAGGEVSMPPLPRDVASVPRAPLAGGETDEVPEPVDEIAASGPTPSVDVSGPAEQPFTADPSDLDRPVVESSILSNSRIASDDSDDEIANTDVPSFDQGVAATIVQVEPNVMTETSSPPATQLDLPSEPADLAIDTTTTAPGQTNAVSNQPQGEMVSSISEESSPAIDTGEDAVQEPAVVETTQREFEIVRRIPVPTSKSLLTSEDVGPSGDEASDLSEAPSVVRSSPEVIDVEDHKIVAEAEAWLKVAEAMAPKAIPHDEVGPLPVRKVQLAESKVALPGPSVADRADHGTQENHPVPVNRVALPEQIPAPAPGEYHPAPVRRIQLSELPVRIQR